MLREQRQGASACAAHCCALVVRTWEEDLEYLQLENGPCISARTLHLPQSAATIQDAVVFLSACRAAPKKKMRGSCLAPRIISHRCNGSSATLEAARKSLCLD